MTAPSPSAQSIANGRVSVVIPAYRAAPWIAETLSTVTAQSEAPREVILIDDGSDDGTADVAATFADRLPQLQIVQQPNQGSAQARNRGLGLARAPYVCFLDADDLLAPDALPQQADFLDAHTDVALVYSSVLEFEEVRDGSPVISRERPDPQTPLHERLLEGAYACLPSAALQRRESAEAIGGFLPGFSSGEDYDFYIRLAFAGYRMAHAATPPLRYRFHPGQRSGDPILSRSEMLDALLLLLGRMPPEHPSRSKLIDRIRYLRLLQAGELDQRGRTVEARRMLLASLSFPLRPGHLVEAARLFRRPARVLDWLGHPPESRRDRT